MCSGEEKIHITEMDLWRAITQDVFGCLCSAASGCVLTVVARIFSSSVFTCERVRRQLCVAAEEL